MKARKKPVVVEVYKTEWGKSAKDAIDFCKGAAFLDEGQLYIKSLEGPVHCEVGEWIIKGVQGEFYTCKPDIFEKTYEILEEEK